MLVSEMFLLMLLDGRKGKVFSRGRGTKDLGLAGAMILDLYLRGRVSIYGKKSRILDYHISGYPYLDQILVFLYRSKRPLKLKTWLNRVSHFYKKLAQYIFQRLENQGILICGFKKRRYYLVKPEIKNSLLDQMKKVVINNMSPGIELLCLLSLMKVCRLFKIYFIRKFRKQVRRRIKELLHSPYYTPNARQIILSIIKAIEQIIRARKQAAASVAAVPMF